MSVTHSHLKFEKIKVAALSVQLQIIKGVTGVGKRMIVTAPCQNESNQTTNQLNETPARPMAVLRVSKT